MRLASWILLAAFTHVAFGPTGLAVFLILVGAFGITWRLANRFS